MIVVDCPGFADKRHPILNVANMINMITIMQAAKKKSILIAIEFYVIEGERASSLNDFQKFIEGFLRIILVVDRP